MYASKTDLSHNIARGCRQNAEGKNGNKNVSCRRTTRLPLSRPYFLFAVPTHSDRHKIYRNSTQLLLFTHSSSFTVSVAFAATLLTLPITASAASWASDPNSASLAFALSIAAKSLLCALSIAPFSGP